MLNYKIWTSKTAAGISLKSVELYVVVFALRLTSILRHQGYLPFDKTGDWFYHCLEALSLASVVLIGYGIFGPLISTYDGETPTFVQQRITHPSL